MPRNKGWFRVYDRMIDSPEVVQLSDSEFRLLVSMWCLASASGNEDGLVPFNLTGLRRRTMPDHTEDEVAAMLGHLEALDLIRGADGHYIVQRWTEHQYQFESKRPSTRRQREGMGNTSGSVREVFGKTDTDTDTETDTEGNNEVHAPTPCGAQPGRAESRDSENDSTAATTLPPMTEEERETLQVLCSVPGYPFKFARDLEHIRTLAVEFPTVDILAEAKKWRTYKLDKPLKPNSNPRSQFRTWCEKALEFAAKRGPGQSQRPQARAEPKAWATLRRMMAEEMRKEAASDDPG